jgi:hypothetical protein
MVGGVPLTSLNYIPESNASFSVSGCTNGQYYHNNDNSSLRMLEVCASGINKTLFEFI